MLKFLANALEWLRSFYSHIGDYKIYRKITFVLAIIGFFIIPFVQSHDVLIRILVFVGILIYLPIEMYLFHCRYWNLGARLKDNIWNSFLWGESMGKNAAISIGADGVCLITFELESGSRVKDWNLWIRVGELAVIESYYPRETRRITRHLRPKNKLGDTNELCVQSETNPTNISSHSIKLKLDDDHPPYGKHIRLLISVGFNFHKSGNESKCSHCKASDCRQSRMHDLIKTEILIVSSGPKKP